MFSIVADADGSLWQSPVSLIKLVQLNRTVTDQYCASPHCVTDSGLGVDYLLPLHPRFPLVFGIVTLQFRYDLHAASGAARRRRGGSFPPYGWTSKNYVICVCFRCHGTSSYHTTNTLQGRRAKIHVDTQTIQPGLGDFVL